jgi:peptide/nickel transport system permease protein
MRSFFVYLGLMIIAVALVISGLFATNPGSTTLVGVGNLSPPEEGNPILESPGCTGGPGPCIFNLTQYPAVGLPFADTAGPNASVTFTVVDHYGGANTTVDIFACAHGANNSIQGPSCHYGVGPALLVLSGGKGSGTFTGWVGTWYFAYLPSVNGGPAEVEVSVPLTPIAQAEEYGAIGAGVAGLAVMFLGFYLRDPLNRPTPRLAQAKRTLYFLFQSKLAVIGLSIVVFFAIVAILSPVLAPYSPAVGTCISPGCLGNYDTLPLYTAYDGQQNTTQYGGPGLAGANDQQCVYPNNPVNVPGGGTWYGNPAAPAPNGDCVPFNSDGVVDANDLNYIIPTWSFYPFNPGPVPMGSLAVNGAAGYVDIFESEVRATPWDLTISVSIVAAGSSIGLVLGTVAGYLGGLVDEVIMRLTDVFLSIPGFLLVLIIMVVIGSNSSLPNSIDVRFAFLVGAFVITWWPSYTRIIRGQVLVTREQKFVEAARACGARSGRIIRKHIIPNSIFPMLVQFSLDVGAIPLALGGIAFLGFANYIFPASLTGAPFPEWGILSAFSVSLSSNAAGVSLFSQLRAGYAFPWWEVAFPGLTLFLFCIAVNFFSDGLRDALDPRLRR